MYGRRRDEHPAARIVQQMYASCDITYDVYVAIALLSGALHVLFVFYFYSEHYRQGLSYVALGVNLLNLFTLIGMYTMTLFNIIDGDGDVVTPALHLINDEGLPRLLKDIINITAITQVLAAVSMYWWCLLILLPYRVYCIFFNNYLQLWIYQATLENYEHKGAIARAQAHSKKSR